MEYLYSEEEFENLNGTALQQKVQEVKQRFDYRRSYFHTLRNNVSDIDQWTDLNNKILDFDRNKLQPWNQQWNNIYRSNDKQAIKNYFKQGSKFFQEYEENVGNIKPQYLSTDEIEALKENVLNRIDEDMVTIKNEITEQVNKGIQDLLDLKSEMGLQKNFAENLKIVRTNSNSTKYIFLGGFILSLVLIGVFLVYSYNLDFIQNLEPYEKILIRLGTVSTLGILSYVLFQQFRLHQILHLKYTHLDNFLGGGATYISQLVSQDGELKRSTNKRLTEMFMEIEDTMGTAKQIEHPNDKYAKTINSTLETVLNKVNDLASTVRDIKNPNT
ncbi:hypothetical protein [Salegentibacter maritimus]|uniref:hypothetical protein n=1 Tax=Salegentibacter maritimus TaxID=2794347 RepID=UPI0018E48DDD|nr:hypothetical protein [Salegentibacter maritimus]MBI6118322.1 hypothetical protein [Salegentibacter maritimus]